MHRALPASGQFNRLDNILVIWKYNITTHTMHRALPASGQINRLDNISVILEHNITSHTIHRTLPALGQINRLENISVILEHNITTNIPCTVHFLHRAWSTAWTTISSMPSQTSAIWRCVDWPACEQLSYYLPTVLLPAYYLVLFVTRTCLKECLSTQLLAQNTSGCKE